MDSWKALCERESEHIPQFLNLSINSHTNIHVVVTNNLASVKCFVLSEISAHLSDFPRSEVLLMEKGDIISFSHLLSVV